MTYHLNHWRYTARAAKIVQNARRNILISVVIGRYFGSNFTRCSSAVLSMQPSWLSCGFTPFFLSYLGESYCGTTSMLRVWAWRINKLSTCVLSKKPTLGQIPMELCIRIFRTFAVTLNYYIISLYSHSI